MKTGLKNCGFSMGAEHVYNCFTKYQNNEDEVYNYCLDLEDNLLYASKFFIRLLYKYVDDYMAGQDKQCQQDVLIIRKDILASNPILQYKLSKSR